VDQLAVAWLAVLVAYWLMVFSADLLFGWSSYPIIG
jgi:hypothetical protein